MTTSENIPELVKSSDVVVSLFRKASDHAPFLLSSFFTSVAISLAPIGFFPEYFHEFHWAFSFLSLFLGLYILFLSYYSQRRKFQARRHLKHIGVDEKALLREYLDQNVSCMILSPILNGPAATLISKKILVVSSSIFSATQAPVAIQPVFQSYLQNHPNVVGLTKNDIGKQSYYDGTGPDPDGF